MGHQKTVIVATEMGHPLCHESMLVRVTPLAFPLIFVLLPAGQVCP